MKSFHFFFVLLFCAATNSLFAQGWEQLYDGGQSDNCFNVQKTIDNNYFIIGSSSNGLGTSNGFNEFIMKITEEGESLWVKSYESPSGGIYSRRMTPDAIGGVLVHSKKRVNTGLGAIYAPLLIKLDSDGNILWEAQPFATLNIAATLQATFLNADGTYTFFAHRYTGDVFSSYDYYIGKIDENGNLLWVNKIAAQIGEFNRIVENPNGGFRLLARTNIGFDIFDFDAAGNIIGVEDYNSSTLRAYNFFLQPNNEIIVVSGFGIDGLVQTRFDGQKNIIDRDTIWSAKYIKMGYSELLDDGIIIAASTYPDSGDDYDIILIRTDLDGNVVWTRTHNHLPGYQMGLDVTRAHGEGFIVAGFYSPEFQFNNSDAYVFKINEEGHLYTNIITGTIAIDDNLNCLVDTADLAVKDWKVFAEKAGHTLVASSDENGNYFIALDSGSYTLNLIPPSVYWETCNNNVAFNFSDFNNQDSLDFSLQRAINCPGMVVSGVIPFVRPCIRRPGYINYCNYGTAVAEDAYIEIVLDSLLSIDSSSLPWSSVNGNTYTFELGDVDPLECGSFRLEIMLDCAAEVGLSYCMETTIYPDSLCVPVSPLWSGAFLEVGGSCQGSDVFFRVQNTGSEGMNNPSRFIIVEDAILVKRDSVQLLAGEIRDIPFPSNGATYTLIANQIPNAPGNSMPIAVVEACGTEIGSIFSTNFSNQFPQNDADPFIDIDCPIANNSYDPNDKQSYPLGYRDQHYIELTTPIEYMIRFQNTGTDTAYHVVIRDSLASWLDISTLQRGASSHPYDFKISGEGHLDFTFTGINLPDSSTNLLDSEGFVSFKILPKNDVPQGTVIKNQAGIYFDFNPPIITNETYHTIAEDFIEVLVGTTDHPRIKGIEVSVAPNPFAGKTTFIIKGYEAAEYLLEVYDVSGKLIRTAKPNGTQFEWDAASLAQGIYFYRLTSVDGFLNTGKIIVK